MRVTRDTVPDIQTFYKKYRPLVVTNLRKLGAQPEDMDDLYQDVILRVLQTDFLSKYGRPTEGKTVASFSTYIFLITRSVFLNKRRKSLRKEFLGFKGTKKVWSDYKKITDIPLEVAFERSSDDSGAVEVNIPDTKVTNPDCAIILQDFRKYLSEQKASKYTFSYVSLWDSVSEGKTLIEFSKVNCVESKQVSRVWRRVKKMFLNFTQEKGLTVKLLLGN